MSSINCADCGTNLPEEWIHQEQNKKCPKCGSQQQTVTISFSDHLKEEGLGILDHLKMTEKDDTFSSKKKQRKEFISGAERSKSNGKWIDKTRLIDRDNGKYFEKIVCLETGEIIHLDESSLSEHKGHGTAKFKKNENEEFYF